MRLRAFLLALVVLIVSVGAYFWITKPDFSKVTQLIPVQKHELIFQNNTNLLIQKSSEANKALEYIYSQNPDLKNFDNIVIAIENQEQINKSSWQEGEALLTYYSYSVGEEPVGSGRRIIYTFQLNTSLLQQYGWSKEDANIFINAKALSLLTAIRRNLDEKQLDEVTVQTLDQVKQGVTLLKFEGEL